MIQRRACVSVDFDALALQALPSPFGDISLQIVPDESLADKPYGGFDTSMRESVVEVENLLLRLDGTHGRNEVLEQSPRSVAPPTSRSSRVRPVIAVCTAMYSGSFCWARSVRLSRQKSRLLRDRLSSPKGVLRPWELRNLPNAWPAARSVRLIPTEIASISIRERASATMFVFPERCLTSVVNSEIVAKCLA